MTHFLTNETWHWRLWQVWHITPDMCHTVSQCDTMTQKSSKMLKKMQKLPIKKKNRRDTFWHLDMSLTPKVFKFNGPSKDGQRHRRGTYFFWPETRLYRWWSRKHLMEPPDKSTTKISQRRKRFILASFPAFPEATRTTFPPRCVCRRSWSILSSVAICVIRILSGLLVVTSSHQLRRNIFHFLRLDGTGID
jgi:hypothetical protein